MKILDGTRVYDLQLSDAQLAVVNEGLMQVPFGRAAPVVAEINQQLDEQRKLASVAQNGFIDRQMGPSS